MTGAQIHARHQRIAACIPAGSTILDVGCSDGALLAMLRNDKGTDGRGIEIAADKVQLAVARGLSVVQGDALHDLAAFPDQSVDFAILSETLQAMIQPVEVLRQLLRIGRKAIVAFPNFGYWRVRFGLLLSGRMPVTRTLPVSWHETQNIHLCTVADFKALASELGLVIERQTYLAQGKPVCLWPNFRADHALFVLSKRG